MNPFLSLIGTATLLAAPLNPGDAARRDRYQKLADGLAWKVAPAEGRSLARDLNPDYQLHDSVTISDGQKSTRVIIESADGKQELYAWDEHGLTAWVVRDPVIYRADYHGMSTGCAIIAFDLKAGKQLWRSELKGLGPIDHSKYRNRVRIEKVDNTVFAVYGDESAGRYVELIEYRTGQTLGHKVFPRD